MVLVPCFYLISFRFYGRLKSSKVFYPDLMKTDIFSFPFSSSILAMKMERPFHELIVWYTTLHGLSFKPSPSVLACHLHGVIHGAKVCIRVFLFSPLSIAKSHASSWIRSRDLLDQVPVLSPSRHEGYSRSCLSILEYAVVCYLLALGIVCLLLSLLEFPYYCHCSLMSPLIIYVRQSDRLLLSSQTVSLLSEPVCLPVSLS